MSIKVIKLHYEVKRKLNRINTSYSSNLSVVDLDSALNEAKDIVYENYAAILEKNTTIRNHMRELEVKGKALLPVAKFENYSAYRIPLDCYRLMRQVVVATRELCDSRSLIVRMRQTDDVSEILVDPYRKPSFDYEETIADEAGSDVIVYKDSSFDLGELTIDYLKRLPDVAAPSLTKTGSYVNSEGDTLTEDRDLIISSTNLWRKIVDVATLIIQRDVSDVQGFQSQINKILSMDKIYTQ